MDLGLSTMTPKNSSGFRVFVLAIDETAGTYILLVLLWQS